MSGQNLKYFMALYETDLYNQMTEHIEWPHSEVEQVHLLPVFAIRSLLSQDLRDREKNPF